MDCIHARMLIVLHGRDAQELDAQAAAGLEQHLEQCADCVAWSSQESRVDDALAQAIRKVPVPADLPSKILHHLEHQPRTRHYVRWLSAAAACVLLALSAGAYAWFNQPTELPFSTISADYVALTSAKSVEDSFAEQGVHIVPPDQLNYDLYQWCGFVTLKGRRVPRIDFFHPGDAENPAAIAHAYVISQEQFDVQELIDSVPSPLPSSNNHFIEVVRPANAEGFVHIFVYTGNTLRPFLAPRIGI